MKLIASPLLPLTSADTIPGRISLRILNEIRNVFRKQLRHEMLAQLPVYAVERNTHEIHMLVCKRDFEMAMITAGQLNHLAKTGHAYIFHDDGTLNDEMEDEVKKRFPGTLLVRRKMADFIAAQKLRAFPQILEFRKRNILAMKLIDTALWAQNKRIGYLDSDVLFFRHPTEYLKSFEEHYTANYFNQDIQDGYFASSREIKNAIGYAPGPKINAGLWVMNKSDLDFHCMETWLDNPFIKKYESDYRLEQTLTATLANKSEGGAAHFSSVYDISFTKQPSESVCKHYVGRIRYGYELEGIKYIFNNCPSPSH